MIWNFFLDLKDRFPKPSMMTKIEDTRILMLMLLWFRNIYELYADKYIHDESSVIIMKDMNTSWNIKKFPFSIFYLAVFISWISSIARNITLELLSSFINLIWLHYSFFSSWQWLFSSFPFLYDDSWIVWKNLTRNDLLRY